MPKVTIKDQIKRIERLGKRDLSTGLIYANPSQRTRKAKQVTLFGLFVSDEETFMIRPHVFEKKEGLNPQQWAAWFAGHYGEILRDSILPGMGARTDKQWRLYRIIGWVPRVHTRLDNPATRRKRNKTKSSRRKNG